MNWIDETSTPLRPSWSSVDAVFPNARTLGLTAVPTRGPNLQRLQAEMREADAAVLRERAQWLNWRAYVHAVDEQRPFTPYHAASRRKAS